MLYRDTDFQAFHDFEAGYVEVLTTIQKGLPLNVFQRMKTQLCI
jgi:hypothetical protein